MERAAAIHCCESKSKMVILIGITKQYREGTMPYVNIKITKEGVTAEQKEKLVQGATQLLFDILGKKPQTTYVVIDEVDTDNWGGRGRDDHSKKKTGK
jgi:4-oxalocrotonate tautomerase